jgi:AGCS family alanine or glycine:cation symporter
MVWDVSEIFNGLMALPNLYALWRLSGGVVEETQRYFSQKKEKHRRAFLSGK